MISINTALRLRDRYTYTLTLLTSESNQKRCNHNPCSLRRVIVTLVADQMNGGLSLKGWFRVRDAHPMSTERMYSCEYRSITLMIRVTHRHSILSKCMDIRCTAV